MELQFLGANNEVTGSCTMVKLPSGKKLIIDCGVMQDSSMSYDAVYKSNSKDFEFDLEEVSHIIMTHAHLDHIGKIPLLVKRGYNGKIVATEPTVKLASVNLSDSSYLMQKEAEFRNKSNKGIPYRQLYSIEDVNNAVSMMQCYDYKQKIHIDRDTTIEFLPNGHIMGSAMVKLSYVEDQKSRSILFTGDTSGFSKRHPFVPPAERLGRVDTIVTEATYGGRFHKDVDIRKEIEMIIRKTCLDNKKTLLLPVFSIQRSTGLAQIIYEVLSSNKDLSKIPVYLDSPMAVESTEIINDSKDFWTKDWIEKDTFFHKDFVTYIKSPKASKNLANGKPKIILSSSGMMQGGRILHHLVSFLPSKGCTILLTGYCGEGTLAHTLISASKPAVNVLGKQVAIRADIIHLPFSSHADQDELVELIESSSKKTLKNIFIMHGNESECISLKRRLQRSNGKVSISIPKYQQTITINH